MKPSLSNQQPRTISDPLTAVQCQLDPDLLAVDRFVLICQRGVQGWRDEFVACEGVYSATTALRAGIALLSPDPAQQSAYVEALLRQAHDDDCLHLPERCFELVLAWGCGRCPAQLLGPDPAQLWPKAVLALARLSEPLVGTVLRQLAALHLPSPIHERVLNLRRDPAAGEQSYAGSLALDIVATNAFAAWQPAHHSLANYLLRVFGGTLGRGSLRSAAFAKGLLYPLLREELGLLVETVAFSVCASPACHAERIDRAITQFQPIQVTELGGVGLFEGAHCASCGCIGDPRHTYRVQRRHRLLVPRAYGGAYEERLFMNCTACGHYFPCSASYIEFHQIIEGFRAAHDLLLTVEQRKLLARARDNLSQQRATMVCPLCRRHAVSQRPVQLWVYAPAGDTTSHKLVP